MEKTELQHQGKSKLFALFGIPSRWGSQNDMLQQKIFEVENVFPDLEQTTTAKKTATKKLKIIQLITFIVTISERLLNFISTF